jgi:hypothetical protein
VIVFQVHLICHPWDLLDEGVDEVLDRLQGELGVSGVCVPVVCPPLAVLRARPGAWPRVFRTRGGLFFAPREEHYQATRYAPVVSTWLKGRDPLRRIAEGCRKHNLACRAVVATSTAGRMTTRHPYGTAKTVFGDPWPDRLCLVNPDVQSFLVGVCRDLADNYGPTAIELTELHAGRIGERSGGLGPGFDMGPGGEALLRTCFCESCRQLDRTGSVDVASAARSAENRLLGVLETGRPIGQMASEVLAEDPALGAYVECQWRALTGLVRAVRNAVGCGLIVHAYDDLVSATAVPYPPRGDGAPLVDAVLTPVERPSGEHVESAARTALARAGPGTDAELQVPACALCGGTATSPDAAMLVRTLSRLAELGIASVNLDSYGQIPAAGLTGVKQAVRFAGRVARSDPAQPAG